MKHQNKSLWHLPLFTLVGVLLLCTLSNTSAQNASQIAEKALASTVYLEMQDRNGAPLGWGSGFFIRHNLIATNYHVIKGAAGGVAKLIGNDRTYTLKGITAMDEINDLVLLHVGDGMYAVKSLPLGDSDAIRIGETVYVLGNPLGLEGTVSKGIISSRRNIDTKELLQMTAPISPGSSGGPVLNQKGNVIGVSASTHRDPSAQNLNFAIPSNYLQVLLNRSGIAKPFSPESEPMSLDFYDFWGVLRGAMGDHEGAIVYFDTAIKLNPDNAVIYRYRGNAKVNLGQYFAAIEDYDMAIHLDSDDATLYHYRGLAKTELGQYLAAIADYDIAIRLEPSFASYYHRGIAKADLGKYLAAIIDYNTAIRLRPDVADTHIKRGLARTGLGQHIAAIIDYNTALRIEPDDATAYYYRGNAKANLGRYFAAIADYDPALHFKPNYIRAYMKRGLAKAESGQHFSAIADYDAVIRLSPDDATAYYYRGVTKANLGQHFSAVADYDTAIRLNPDYAAAYYNRAIAKESLGSLWEAKQDFRIALKLMEQNGDQSAKAKIELRRNR